MRLRTPLSRSLPATFTTALLLLSNTTPVAAFPYPRDSLEDFLGIGFLMPRQCAAYCGSDKFCCPQGAGCFTSGVVVGCQNTAAGGGFGLYTTTWTETRTYTSTKSSWFPAATTVAPANCIPEPGTGQIACGSICCANWQYCAYQNQCSANGGWAGGGGGGGDAPPAGTTYMTTMTSGGQVITTQYSAPYRVTGSDVTNTGTAIGATSTGNGTVGAGGTAGSLSPGAIAGIVIGVIAGVAILLLICACFLVRGLWNGLMGLFGGKKKKRSREEVIIEEERYSRHGGSVHGRRERHGGWFGGGGGRPSTVASRKEEKKKSSSGAGWLGLGAAAGTLLLLLGLRRDKKRKNTKARSDVSSSYFSDSYTASSPSSRSTRRSGRTHRTDRTRRSETTRLSRAPSRRP